MNEEGFVTELQRFCYAESGGLQLWARVVRLCGHPLVHLSTEERSRLLRTAHKIHITVIPPDENGKPRRWAWLARGWGEGVASADRLQSLAHQLASDQSMPLMITNQSGTVAPTLPSTASVHLQHQTAVNRVTAKNNI